MAFVEEMHSPACRYGHGPLEKLKGAFQMTGADVSHVKTGLLDERKLVAKPNNGTLTICCYWCKECGYVEFRDTRDSDD